MEREIKLTREGYINVVSGEILIADPCFVKNGRDILKYEDPFEKAWNEITSEEVQMLEKSANRLKEISKPNQSNPKEMIKYLKEFSSAMGEIEKDDGYLNRKKEELKKRKDLILYPPFMGQEDTYLLVRNGIGDGNYPVVKRRENIVIIINYPIAKKGKSIVIDEKKIKGNIIGYSDVESGIQIITDPLHVQIEEEDRSLYVKTKMPVGAYRCTFINRNNEFLIEKI